MTRRRAQRLGLIMILAALGNSSGVERSRAEPGKEDAPVDHAVTITKEDYRGWPNTYRLSNGVVEARILTDVGPRIIDVRRVGGDNLFLVRESEVGGTGEKQWMFRGGWRLWTAPERAETTYALDNSACTTETIAGTGIRVTGPQHTEAGIRKKIEVTLTPGEPRLRVTSHITNIGEGPLTYAAWSLPVMRRGGRAFVPLDVGSLTAFDDTRSLILWSYTKLADPRYRFRDRLIEIDHARVAAPPPGQSGRRSDESKIGTDSKQGWIAYLLDGTLFLKRFPHSAGAPYPDSGSTIEVYSSHEFLELEHLGPLTTIQPGEEIVLPEDWWLFPNVSVPEEERSALDALRHFVARAPMPPP